jgi:heme/copper-type cytochrome/quinol oxidase subunit 1
MTKLTPGSIYTIAIMLFIIGLPIILISSIVGIVQETRRIHLARVRGEHMSYAQPKLLAELAVLLFILLLVAAGAVYAGITYRLVSPNLLWVSIVLVVIAGLCGFFSVIQRVNGNSSAQNS